MELIVISLNMIEGLGMGYALVKVIGNHCWRWLLLLVKIVFSQEYSDLACVQAENNAEGNVDYNELFGLGWRGTLQQQAQLPAVTNAQIRILVCKVWRGISDTQDSSKSFAVIQQASGETFINFVNRLSKAIERQVDNLEAVNILTKQLAYENSNQDCKEVMKSTTKWILHFLI